MRILHYTLGLPPVRSGGLTKYAIDLMKEQSKNDEVIHLFPGKIDFLKTHTRISQIRKRNDHISHFQIINSLPLPLFRGIKEPVDFMKRVPKKVYLDFLTEVKPNVIHIHTLMGLHSEFFESAKALGIKLVYTTHDYFGICPTINLYKEHESTNCNNYKNGKGCADCSIHAMGTKALLLTQTPFYPTIKKLKKLIPPKKPSKLSTRKELESNNFNENRSEEYVTLRKYYLDILRKIDYFHFNSVVTMQVYKEYLPEIEGKVVNITHSGIMKASVEKSNYSKIRIGYLGPYKEHKGFFILLEAFKLLASDQFELHLFGDSANLEPMESVFTHGSFRSDQLKDIFTNLDVLVVPSVWKETFGFVALEGLSFGTPVIISENVGSKDLVLEKFGWTVDSNSSSELYNLLKNLNKEVLLEKHLNITRDYNVKMIENHAQDIMTDVYK